MYYPFSKEAVSQAKKCHVDFFNKGETLLGKLNINWSKEVLDMVEDNKFINATEELLKSAQDFVNKELDNDWEAGGGGEEET